jgi:acyl-coenzyme A thioesterase PaaI-like protein
VNDGRSLQERFAPEGRCFGCGPANELGLRIRSFEAADGTVVADWQARPEHEAFDGFVNGGILGTLIDCHSNWTAIAALLARGGGAAEAPSTVTAEYSVRFRRPTPSDRPVRLIGRAVDFAEDRVTVDTTLESDGVTTVIGRATFVAVKAGHPAFGRW